MERLVLLLDSGFARRTAEPIQLTVDTVAVSPRSGDIVLVENDPLDVVRLVRLSKASYRKMQENLVQATDYSVFALPLAAGVLAPIGVLLSPAIGAVFVSLSTIIVAINARRLEGVDLTI